ncbi:hypothetical protein DU500_13145 [Haloplanus rubicundus]|uniref:DUF1102 domain-containing protein n=1 Tax=Haloplanus rubicundus TaxID=1547898 RepID=A0A345EES2_9EURY|nr:hypothetical protein [Haloplanus rubicundus]AXG07293.1 hypothetical protein DU500_13145 [Haloplanus rubicundus]AXG10694.1 hypothetical protein DU484_13045 [Haloplanus rubicundus]
MSRRTRRIVALVALCIAASMALGVGSYSSVSAERSVSVSVVPPEEAYLGFDENLRCGPGNSAGVGNGQPFLHNQFAADIDDIKLRVTALGGYVRVRADESPKGAPAKQLTPNDPTATLVFEDTYGPGSSVELEIYGPSGVGTKDGADELRIELVEATGPNVRVAGADKTYEVNCPDQYSPPEGEGSGENGGGQD